MTEKREVAARGWIAAGITLFLLCAILVRGRYVDLMGWSLSLADSLPSGLVQGELVARSKHLSGLSIRVSAPESRPMAGEIVFGEASAEMPILQLKREIPVGETIKFKFRRIPDSRGKKYQCRVRLEGGEKVQVWMAAHYSLTMGEALPYILFNLTKERPFPLSVRWLHGGLLLGYIAACGILFRLMILLAAYNGRDGSPGR